MMFAPRSLLAGSLFSLKSTFRSILPSQCRHFIVHNDHGVKNENTNEILRSQRQMDNIKINEKEREMAKLRTENEVEMAQVKADLHQVGLETAHVEKQLEKRQDDVDLRNALLDVKSKLLGVESKLLDVESKLDVGRTPFVSAPLSSCVDMKHLNLLGNFLTDLYKQASATRESGQTFDPFHLVPNSPNPLKPYQYLILPYIPNCPDQTVLLVRPEYETLFELVENHYSESIDSRGGGGCIILGNLGIGKSVSCLNYFLVRAALCGIPVVVQLDSAATTIFFSHVEPPVLIPFRQPHASLASTKTWYLVDPAGLHPAQEPIRASAFTMLFSSPDVARFKEFGKRTTVSTHVLPVWDLDGLKAICPLLQSTTNVTTDVLTKRYAVVGGLIRHLFSQMCFAKGVSKMESSIGILSADLIEKVACGHLTQVEAAFPTPFHFLFHCTEVKVEDSRLKVKTVTFASSLVRSKVSVILANLPRLKAHIAAFHGQDGIAFESSFFRSLEAPSVFYDARAFQFLPKQNQKMETKYSRLDCAVPSCSLVSKGRFRIGVSTTDLEELFVKPLNLVELDGKLPRPGSYRCLIKNEASFDGLIVTADEIFLLKVTVKKAHDIKTCPLIETLKQIAKAKSYRVYFVWVVHEYNFLQLTTPGSEPVSDMPHIVVKFRTIGNSITL